MSAWKAWSLPPGVDLGAPGGHERERRPTAATAGFRWLDPSPAAFAELLGALRRAGDELRRQPAAAVARVLGEVGRRFLDDADPLRREALERLPAQAGVSPEQARWTLDGMARDWTPERLEGLLAAEFGEAGVLDGFRRVERGGLERSLRASGPRLALHVTAGSVAGVSVHSLIRGLLVKGPVLLKPGAGDAVLPVLFARGLTEAAETGGVGVAGGSARALARSLAVLYWPGGSGPLESAALAAADQVVVYGGDETVRAVGRQLGAHQRLVAYPHRLSVAVVGPEALAKPRLAATAASLARAVASFDQRGCVCPHQVFLPGADAATAEALAEALAGALAREAETLPPGPLEPDEASEAQQVRGVEELREAAGQGVRVWASRGLDWTVVLDPEPRLAEGCLARTVRVTPLAALDDLAAVLAPHADHLQSAGVEGYEGDQGARLAELLAEAGVTRIAPLDQIAFPPPWWLHDGRGPLTDLVRWTEWV